MIYFALLGAVCLIVWVLGCLVPGQRRIGSYKPVSLSAWLAFGLFYVPMAIFFLLVGINNR